jgi:hypothetical protein
LEAFHQSVVDAMAHLFKRARDPLLKLFQGRQATDSDEVYLFSDLGRGRQMICPTRVDCR